MTRTLDAVIATLLDNRPDRVHNKQKSALGVSQWTRNGSDDHSGSMGNERKPGDDDGEHSAAMRRVYRDPEDKPDPDSIRTFTLDVDGEQFAVRLVADPATGYTDTGYTWLSGPNKGYGFGTGGPPNPSLEEHRQRIREFLAMVDPTTGYIEDD